MSSEVSFIADGYRLQWRLKYYDRGYEASIELFDVLINRVSVKDFVEMLYLCIGREMENAQSKPIVR